ncbi:MAG: hypothetical protein HY831_02010 [Candidatus Aenigmarchaeota archaeon]|nr:hypothetical protein [Candidatus Aenigmarchaeota archaeon]
MKKYFIILLLVLFVSVGYSLEASVNIYEDSQNSIPSNVFGNGSLVYLTAYNGVSCCSSVNAEVYNIDGKINVTLIDTKNNGFYKGSFVVGSDATNDSLDYIHSEDNGTVGIFILFTQLSNGTAEINIDYGKPDVVNVTGTFQNGILLNWTTSFDKSGIYRYLIYRSENNITDSDLIYSSKDTSFRDKNVIDGKRYYYSVKAVDSVGNKGDFSEAIYVDTPDVSPPNEINDLFAKGISGGRIVLNWSKPYENTQLDYYLVYRSISSNFSNVSYYSNISSEGFLDQNISDNVVYYYFVISVDRSGNSAKMSNLVYASSDATAPKRIDNLAAYLGYNGTVKLSWKTDCNCSFRVYKSVFPINSIKDLEGLSFVETKEMNYSDKLSSSYYYAVVAFDEFMNSANISNIVKADPDLIAPSSVKELNIVSDSNKKIILSWQPSSSIDLDYYAVYRSVNGSVQIYTTTNKTEYVDYSVSNGQLYYYLIRAVDKFGNEDNNTNFVNATAIDAYVMLEISYPANNSQLSQDRVAVIGKTDSDSIVKIKNVINGSVFESDAIVDKNGLFIGYAPLGDGFNGIEVSTRDVSGNEQKEYVLLNNKFLQTSHVSLDSSLENLKVVVYNSTVNNTISADPAVITELARTDPNIVNEKNNIENYITGNTVPADLSIPFIVIFAVILSIACFVVYKKFLKDKVLYNGIKKVTI